MDRVFSPWAVVAVVAVGVAGMLGFGCLHMPGGDAVMGVVVLGVSALGARRHAQTRHEVQVLRASMRPPSLVDAHERAGTVTPRN